MVFIKKKKTNKTLSQSTCSERGRGAIYPFRKEQQFLVIADAAV